MGIVTRRLLEQSSQQKGLSIQTGTHAMGGYGGTVSFKEKFEGTPSLTLSLLDGTAVGLIRPLRTPTVNSGSFTYHGSAGRGTFAWTAIGP
jgi:hypothetical protein